MDPGLEAALAPLLRADVEAGVTTGVAVAVARRGGPVEGFNSAFWRSLGLPWGGLVTTPVSGGRARPLPGEHSPPDGGRPREQPVVRRVEHAGGSLAPMAYIGLHVPSYTYPGVRPRELFPPTGSR
jgi:hypothetical protein